MESEGTRAVIVALIVEDNAHPARTMRGVRIDLSSADSSDHIYLGEEATARTKAALEEIAEAVGRSGIPGGGSGCMGAREFWPLYGWSWNKYHELNADFCGAAGGGTQLVLSGRNKPEAFFFPGQTLIGLAAVLGNAAEQLKQH